MTDHHIGSRVQAAGILIVTVGFWLLCCIVISVAGQKTNHVCAATALYVGGAALALSAIFGWPIGSSFTIAGIGPLPIYLTVAPFTLRIDAFSAIFVALLGILTMAAGPKSLKTSVADRPGASQCFELWASYFLIATSRP